VLYGLRILKGNCNSSVTGPSGALASLVATASRHQCTGPSIAAASPQLSCASILIASGPYTGIMLSMQLTSVAAANYIVTVLNWCAAALGSIVSKAQHSLWPLEPACF